MADYNHHTMLFRIDPTRNMRRFYAVTIQPNLFGGHSVMRNWGRIGTAGQLSVDLYDTEVVAIAERDRVLRTKERRGYRYTQATKRNADEIQTVRTRACASLAMLW